MSKQRNSNIGHLICLIDGCQEQAAVRRNRSGKLYYDCPDHGRITPNLPAGQDAMLDRATMWGKDGPPPDCARWIAEQWSWGAVMRDPEARDPVNGAGPVNEPAPVDQADPVNEPAPVDEPSAGPKGPPAPPEPKPAPEPEPEPEAEPEETEPAEDDFA